MNVAIGLAAVIDFGANSPQYAQSVAAVPHGSFEPLSWRRSLAWGFKVHLAASSPKRT